jgi:hypothetical protein
LGQKVNPIGLRLGIVKTWESRWFGGKNYAEYILEDHKLRKYIKDKAFPELKSNDPPSAYACGFIPPDRGLSSAKRVPKYRS